MKVMVFDTETTSLEKPFCYNIGYTVYDTEDRQTYEKKDFVVEQIWHNLPLFNTAYYANKRPIYVASMRARKTEMDKFGYICQEMARDIKKYDIRFAYAYNSSFDEKVFNFNCDWFKCINPFDNVKILDIRGLVHQFLITDDYKRECDRNEWYTDSGNYSTTAETVFRYITKDTEFTEEHTALSDSIIETEILARCLNIGAEVGREYETKKSIPRECEKSITIVTPTSRNTYKYKSMRFSKNKTILTIK